MSFKIDLKTKNTYYSSDPHSHESYELYFLLKGTREIFVRNNVYKISAGMFFVIPPFWLHYVSGGEHSRIVVSVTEDELSAGEKAFLAKCFELSAVAPDKRDFDFYTDLLMQAVDLSLFTEEESEEYTRAVTKSFLLSLRRSNHIENAAALIPQSQHDALVSDVTAYLNAAYAEPVTLGDLCKRFYVSKVTLCKRFKNVLSCSIMDYLLKLRLNKAKQLLLTTRDPIETVSEKCGFSSANYFGLVFKKNVGVSPLGYRKRK